MKQVPLYEFIIEEFDEIQANSGFPHGSFVILDYDGTNVWFVLRAVRFEDETIAEEAYCGVRWNLTEGLERFTDIMDKPFELMSRNPVTQNFIVKTTDTLEQQFVQSLDGTGEFWNNALSVEQLGGPSQMAEERAEIAVMSGWGIELLHPNTGGNLVRIKSYDDIDPDGKYRHEPKPRISVSPDGQLLTFALEHIADPGRFTIFTLDREGKELKIIYEDVSTGTPKISGELKED